jgi:hypothetical protein
MGVHSRPFVVVFFFFGCGYAALWPSVVSNGFDESSQAANYE